MFEISLRKTVSASALAAVLFSIAGCTSHGIVPPYMPASSTRHANSVVNYETLYSFKGGADGSQPDAALAVMNGVFYGTTALGGARKHGTIFRITPSGAKRVLHNFARSTDGFSPNALTVANGTLYGTMRFDGPHNAGTVIEVGASGNERVLYAFRGGSDGRFPEGRLTVFNGAFYGTTLLGGTGKCMNSSRVVGCGTVFAVDSLGNERVVYSFQGGPDGSNPDAGLIVFNGMLYGTTLHGGSGKCKAAFSGNVVGCGMIFSLSTTGHERVLYSFKGGNDGSSPNDLIYLHGTLFGTTYADGPYEGGTVFRATPSGHEDVIYSFKFDVRGSTDGWDPVSTLVAVNDSLYGITSGGGKHLDGTVFSVSTSGIERVLHSFSGPPSDGAGPSAGLALTNGALYSTTVWGGNGRCIDHRKQIIGCGTVFKLTP